MQKDRIIKVLKKKIMNDALEKKEKKMKLDKIKQRKICYTCLTHNVAAVNVPGLVENIFNIISFDSIYSSRRTLGRMIGELGFLSDHQTAEAVIASNDATLIFDATTQDGKHVNCILLSTDESCHLVSIQQLAGGTAEDYCNHICDAISSIAKMYSSDSTKNITHEKCMSEITSKIKGCLTDRAPVNHATISLLEKAWSKEFIELNCNLHPLERITAETRTKIATLEDTQARNLIQGRECLAWKTILMMNKLRYSDKRGCIKEFKNFLVHNELKKTLIPRVRGNRLNIMFHISFIYFLHFNDFENFLKGFSKPNDLICKLNETFKLSILLLQFKVFGLVYKLFSGPWMSTFYTSFSNQLSTPDGLRIVKEVIVRLEDQVKDPGQIIYRRHDFLGKLINFDHGFEKLMQPPQDFPLFTSLMESCLESIINVLQRQYRRQYENFDRIVEAGLSSSRQHTMDAESVIGEFGELIRTCPNMNVLTISNLLKGKRNKIPEFLLGCDDTTLANLVKLAMYHGRLLLDRNVIIKQKLEEEISARIKKKMNKEDGFKRKQLEKKIKKFVHENPSLPANLLRNEFLIDDVEKLVEILIGELVGKTVTHIWEDEGNNVRYRGIVRSFSIDSYLISYFRIGEDEEDILLTKFEAAADYLQNNLFII